MTSANKELQLSLMTRFLYVPACLYGEGGGIDVELFMCSHKCLIDLH